MSVLDRSELEQSHLADLHAIASELGIEGFRRLGRDALIDAILGASGGEPAEEGTADESSTEEPATDDAAADDSAESAEAARKKSRRLRLRRGREKGGSGGTAAAAAGAESPAERSDEPLAESDGDDGAEVVIPEGDDGQSRAATGAAASSDESEAEPEKERAPAREEEVRNGVLDILPGGSGFMRADAFVHSSEDVYVSPAQIRRCELRAGDEISGPIRPPRRSERYPSLVRVATVNGQDADAITERPLFDDLTPTFASDPLETIHGLPFGKGSRVAIGGPPGAGATRLLREATEALEGDLDVLVVLSGVRPEEVTEWKRAENLAVAGGGFDRPPEELAQIAEMAVERAKRIAERGGDAVLVIDGLDSLQSGAARRIFGAARNTEEAGSLTIVAATGSAAELQRLASTRVTLTPDGILDDAASGTLRADLLGA